MGDAANGASNGFDVEYLLTQLTTDEKVALVSGVDFWHTASVPRLGIPAIRTSDGPNGVRGTKFFNGVPAAAFPCGTALAATWDKDLINKGGVLMGQEALAKGAAVILGPTINMQRGPLGGRGFESYSEDPVLAGDMAAATVNGIQSTGVVAAIKHFVANDLEDKRMASDSVVPPRALREIYLKPFQIAERDAKPGSYMTAYNKLNGTHCSEHEELLRGILRGEWQFDGLVMSDWFGTYSAAESVRAGLDLEMPGPTYVRGQQVKTALHSGKLLIHELDRCVREVLKLVERTLPLNLPEDAEEKTIDTPETAQMLRRVAAEGCVLLKNEKSLLPLDPSKKTAVIGGNAAVAAYCGGGSASLLPYHAVSPLDGIKAQAANVQYALGSPGWKRLPLLSLMSKSKSGEQGLHLTLYLEPHGTPGRKSFDSMRITDSNVLLADYKHPKKPADDTFYADIDCYIVPDETADYEFSCSVAGIAKIFVDGNLVVDNDTKQTPGDSFFGAGTIEEVSSCRLTAGEKHSVHVEFGTLPTQRLVKEGTTGFGAGGVRLGCYRKVDMADERRRAVECAKANDQVVLCIGLNGDWESEGYDRAHMDLPPGTDDLVRAVLAANPNTVVVNQSGTPVTMPWATEVSALLQAWYGGNETGHAIADVVFGKTNPSGKLSLSFPIRNEDNPAYLNFSSDENRVWYGEDVYIGYRFYEKIKKQVAFPFGHGLSYTTFKLDKLNVSADASTIKSTLTVTNTGSKDGAEVVQVYVAPVSPSIRRPIKELKGFTKCFLKAGESRQVQVSMSKKYSTSFWSEQRKEWICEKGEYEVLVGTSSQDTPLRGSISLPRTTYWSGL
ncbi:hypothetical protein D0868_06993 [Hortaea werneckii]|uniref:beta-glucosidase n=1 Tax=Hortaea werneckii TaxID=91943 RepID=A0A3M6YN72_HORWE|nr:hypothetical protein D0868_06993 [Hortaea werneckii]